MIMFSCCGVISIIKFIIVIIETLAIVIQVVWFSEHLMTVYSVVPLAVLPMSEMLCEHFV